MENIAIIPARGGSKRIPRKNIKLFLGKPIIAYSIEAAISSKAFDEVMVSTDDKEIAEIALKYGAKVPFFRSNEMSSDHAMTLPVLLEVLSKYKKQGKYFERCCCIYPTALFLTKEVLKDAMEMLKENDADCVLPVVRFSFPPQRCCVVREGLTKMLYPENFNVRSQDLEPFYHDAGQFYCFKSESIDELQENLYAKKTLSIELPESEVQDIDNEEDFKIAEMKYKILRRGKRNV